MSDFSDRPQEPPRPTNLSADDLVTLNEEIAGLAKAGLPLDQGLAHLAREMGRGRLQRVTQRLADDLQQGKTLPEALAAQGSALPPYYASLVNAGVRSGRLGEVLATLTTYARTVSEIRTSFFTALTYPLMILLLAGGLLTFWVLFLAPKFAQIYADFRLRLPIVTEAFFTVARQPVLFLVLPLALLIGLVIVTRLVLGRTEQGRITWTHFLYAMPILGTLIRSARLAAFTDLLAILVDHHVPLPEAFRLAGEASSDPILRAGSRAVEGDLNEGRALGPSLAGRGMVPSFVAWTTGLGERRGRLGPALRQAAEMYRKQAEMRSHMFRSVFPPILILITAVLVLGVFIIAMTLPMLGLLQGLSGQ